MKMKFDPIELLKSIKWNTQIKVSPLVSTFWIYIIACLNEYYVDHNNKWLKIFQNKINTDAYDNLLYIITLYLRGIQNIIDTEESKPRGDRILLINERTTTLKEFSEMNTSKLIKSLNENCVSLAVTFIVEGLKGKIDNNIYESFKNFKETGIVNQVVNNHLSHWKYFFLILRITSRNQIRNLKQKNKKTLRESQILIYNVVDFIPRTLANHEQNEINYDEVLTYNEENLEKIFGYRKFYSSARRFCRNSFNRINLLALSQYMYEPFDMLTKISNEGELNLSKQEEEEIVANNNIKLPENKDDPQLNKNEKPDILENLGCKEKEFIFNSYLDSLKQDKHNFEIKKDEETDWSEWLNKNEEEKKKTNAKEVKSFVNELIDRGFFTL